MKLIILAAGKGTRLKPLTDEQPKCMVEYQRKPIIDTILETTKECGLENIAIVTGYKEEVLRDYLKKEAIKFFHNHSYATTNMVTTLFCAKGFMDDDVIISYADIVYKKEILEKLIKFDGELGVVVDTEWRELWEKRMGNPLDDAETLKIDNDCIVELGKKPRDYNEIEGQYIGLIKISKRVLKRVTNFYKALDRTRLFDGKDYDNMYMTSFLQLMIDCDIVKIKPVLVEGGWMEIDVISDLNVTI